MGKKKKRKKSRSLEDLSREELQKMLCRKLNSLQELRPKTYRFAGYGGEKQNSRWEMMRILENNIDLIREVLKNKPRIPA